jgi:hypothetical protein
LEIPNELTSPVLVVLGLGGATTSALAELFEGLHRGRQRLSWTWHPSRSLGFDYTLSHVRPRLSLCQHHHRRRLSFALANEKILCMNKDRT